MRIVWWPSNEFGDGCTSKYAFEPEQVVVQCVDELRLDRVFHDRVALLRDASDVRAHVDADIGHRREATRRHHRGTRVGG